MAKMKVAWGLSRLQQEVMYEMYLIGKDAVDVCVYLYDKHEMNRPGKVTHQLRNSIACGVFENGRLREDLVHQPTPEPGKVKKWEGRELWGHSYALEVLRKQKTKAKIALVLVAAMPYRKYLEGPKRTAGTYSSKNRRLKMYSRSGKIPNTQKIGSTTLKGWHSTAKYRANVSEGTGDLGGYIVISDMYQWFKQNRGIASELYRSKKSALANIANLKRRGGGLRLEVGTIKYRG